MPIIERDVENPQKLRNFLWSLATYVHDRHYKLYFPADSLSTNGPRNTLGTYRASIINFSNGVAKRAQVSFPRPRFWLTGKLQLTLWFDASQAPVSSNEVIVLRRDVWGHAIGNLVTSAGTEIHTDTGTTGITLTAAGLQSLVFTTDVEATADHDTLGFSYERDPLSENDDYTGDIRILGVECEYLPTNRQ